MDDYGSITIDNSNLLDDLLGLKRRPKQLRLRTESEVIITSTWTTTMTTNNTFLANGRI